MRTVKSPAPHQSHSSQHPADEFDSRNLGREQKGYPQGHLSSLKLFQLQMDFEMLFWEMHLSGCV